MLLFYCFRVGHMGIAIFRVHGVYRDAHYMSQIQAP